MAGGAAPVRGVARTVGDVDAPPRVEEVVVGPVGPVDVAELLALAEPRLRAGLRVGRVGAGEAVVVLDLRMLETRQAGAHFGQVRL